jgi:predicted TIM-barrel fold metal-dependent hydrolase
MSPSDASTTTHRVDFHHHFMPPAYVAVQRGAMEALAPGFTHALQWMPEKSLDMMDRLGVDLAVATLAIPHMNGLPVEEAVELSRKCNDYGDELTRKHPGRFVTLAALPMPDVEASCAEAARRIGPGGKIGVGLLTNYGDVWLGDERYEPLFSLLDERAAVVYVHPIVATCCTGIMPGFPPAMMEFLFDTARCVSSLAMSGAFEKYPRVRFIFSHGSGAFPMIETRTQGWVDRTNGRPSRRVQHCDNVFVDTASVTTPASFAAVRELFGVPRILFGTDFPYSDGASTVSELDRLGLTNGERESIDHANAIAVLGAAEVRGAPADGDPACG